MPMSGSIVNDAVVTRDQTTPYASVQLKVADYDGDIIGYITNKLDFAMLWAAFNDNTLALDGVHREPPLPGCSNLSKLPHEIWLVWTRKRYAWPANLLPKAALPKLIVMAAHEGTFEEFAETPQYAAHEPVVAWIPEIRLRSRERALLQHAHANIKLLSKVWDDVVTPT
nr:putative integron gene cassette protein [uncultured bacterium]